MHDHEVPIPSPSSRRHLVAVVLLTLLTSSLTFDNAAHQAAFTPAPSLDSGVAASAEDDDASGTANSRRGEPADGAWGGGAGLDPVVVQQASVRVDGVQPGALEVALSVEGVSFATVIATGDAAIAEPGGSRIPLRVAMVDPAGFRVLTPQITADSAPLWARLAEGDAVFTHEFAQRMLLQLGSRVPLGDGQPLRVGAFGTTGTPPVAEAIVSTVTGERLGLSTAPRSLLVAVAPDARPETVAATLQRVLGAPAHVIATTRFPRPVTLAGRLTAANVWDWLAQCESGGDWHINTGNGYYGGLQFLPESWFLVGGTGMPHEASREEQIRRAQMLHAIQGWRAWPVCSILLGLRPGPLPDRYRRGASTDEDVTSQEASGQQGDEATPTETNASPDGPPPESPSEDATDPDAPGGDLPPVPSSLDED